VSYPLFVPTTKRKKSTLHDALVKAIDSSDMSREKICELSGVDRAAMSRAMSGRTRFSIESAERVANVLGLHAVLTTKGSVK